ncbi:MAG: hypothetical protein ACJASC_003514 [Limimaricola cinnabarinus]|jgi:hypothetical protein
MFTWSVEETEKEDDGRYEENRAVCRRKLRNHRGPDVLFELGTEVAMVGE